ncbi:MAG: hypothetical protein RLZZ67_513 [Candidatus Parcubacteria bacterium]
MNSMKRLLINLFSLGLIITGLLFTYGAIFGPSTSIGLSSWVTIWFSFIIFIFPSIVLFLRESNGSAGFCLSSRTSIILLITAGFLCLVSLLILMETA